MNLFSFIKVKKFICVLFFLQFIQNITFHFCHVANESPLSSPTSLLNQTKAIKIHKTKILSFMELSSNYNVSQSELPSLETIVDNLKNIVQPSESNDIPPPGVPPLAPLPEDSDILEKGPPPPGISPPSIPNNEGDKTPPLPQSIPVSTLPKPSPLSKMSNLSPFDLPIYIESPVLAFTMAFIQVIASIFFGYYSFRAWNYETSHYYFLSGSSIILTTPVLVISYLLPVWLLIVSIMIICCFGIYYFLGPNINYQLYWVRNFVCIIISGTLYSFFGGYLGYRSVGNWYAIGGILIWNGMSKTAIAIVNFFCIALLYWFIYILSQQFFEKKPNHHKTKLKLFLSTQDLVEECFVSSFIVTSGISIFLYSIGVTTLSSFDLLGIYTFPTSLRANEISSYINLLLWLILCLIFYSTRFKSRDTDDVEVAQLLRSNKEEQWHLDTLGLRDIDSPGVMDEKVSISSY